MKSMVRLRFLFRKFKRKFLVDMKFCFCVSFFMGALLAVIVHMYQTHSAKNTLQDDALLSRPYDFGYEKWLWSAHEGLSVPYDPDVIRYNMSHLDEYSLNPATEAHFLFNRVPITCIVFPETSRGADTVLHTWGRHCNKILFFSHKIENDTIPIKKFEAKSSFELVCLALQQVEGDPWIFTAQERTFVLVENLRYFLAPRNHSEPHYLGHAMKFWGETYNWDNAGYALSGGTLSRFLNVFNSTKKCREGGKYWKNGDWYLGKHLRRLGIEPKDTRDHLGRGRFNGFSFRKLLFPGGVSLFERYWKDSLYLSQDGPHCCSNYAITFNGILSNSKMYQLEYLFHHLRPFYGGGKYGNVSPPQKGPKEIFLTWEERLKDEALERLMEHSQDLLTTPAGIIDLKPPDLY